MTTLKKTYDTTSKKLDSSLQKEMAEFSKKEAILLEKSNIAKQQSDENYLSIKQTYNQASISFNKKLNELKVLSQNTISNLETNYLSKLSNFEMKEKKYLDGQATTLNQANLEYQNKLDKHNNLFDELKRDYETAVQKIDFEYHNAISILNSSMSSYRERVSEEIKIYQKEKGTDTSLNRKIKELNRDINRFILKTNKAIEQKKISYQKKAYLNELDYLKKLSSWRIEHATLDLEHKQSLLVLENEKTLFFQRMNLEKLYLKNLYQKNKVLNELDHLNMIAPLEVQLKRSLDIQNRELAILSNDTTYINLSIQADLDTLSSNRDYKVNAIEYQKTVTSLKRSFEEKKAILTFQLDIEKVKREFDFNKDNLDFIKESYNIDYATTMLNTEHSINLKRFELNHDQDIVNATYQITSLKEKELYSQFTILTNIGILIANETKKTYETISSLETFTTNKNILTHNVTFEATTLFKNIHNSINNLNSFLTQILTYEVLNKDNSDSLYAIFSNLESQIINSQKIVTETNKKNLSLLFSYIINNFLKALYQLYYDKTKSFYTYKNNTISSEMTLVEREINLLESAIVEKQKTINSNSKEHLDINTLTLINALRRHIKADEKQLSILRNKIQAYKKRELKNSEEFKKAIILLKKEHLTYIKKMNHLEKILCYTIDDSLRISNEYYKSILVLLTKEHASLNIQNLILKSTTSFKVINSYIQKIEKIIQSINSEFEKNTIKRNKNIQFSLLNLEDSFNKNEQRLNSFNSIFEKKYTLHIYKKTSELDLIKKIKHTELIQTYEKNLSNLNKNKLSNQNKIANNSNQFKLDTSYIEQNLAAALKKLDQEHENELLLLNTNLKDEQIKLTTLAEKREKDLKDTFISLEGKNNSTIHRFNLNNRRSIKNLKHTQLSYKKQMDKIKNSIEDLKTSLKTDYRKLKHINHKQLLLLKSSYMKKMIISKKEVIHGSKKEVQDLNKSYKFKHKTLK